MTNKKSLKLTYKNDTLHIKELINVFLLGIYLVVELLDQ